MQKSVKKFTIDSIKYECGQLWKVGKDFCIVCEFLEKNETIIKLEKVVDISFECKLPKLSIFLEISKFNDISILKNAILLKDNLILCNIKNIPNCYTDGYYYINMAIKKILLAQLKVAIKSNNFKKIIKVIIKNNWIFNVFDN